MFPLGMGFLLGFLFCGAVKPVLFGHSKEDQKVVLKTHYRLMQGKSVSECSKGKGSFCNTFDLH